MVEGEFVGPGQVGFQPPTRSKPSASSASAAADGDQASVTAGFCVFPEKQAADEAAVDGDRASDSEWEIHPNKQAADEAAVEIKACVVRARQHNDMQLGVRPLCKWQPKSPNEIVHMYTYISSVSSARNILTLHQMRDGTRTCTFMTRGHCTDSHGNWTLTKGVLTACFNYRWESGRRATDMMPLHPTRLYRMDDFIWEGIDDKACIIRLEHVQSRARHGEQWTHSEPL